MKRVVTIFVSMMLLVGCSSERSDSITDPQTDASMAKIDLATAMFTRLLNQYGDNVDTSKIPMPQQTMMLVYHSYGIIGNGGFQYLFEENFPGDPEFLLTQQAYKTIGASNASVAFEKAFAAFPNSTPPADLDRRLEMWQSKYNRKYLRDDKSSPDHIYFNAMDEVMSKLNLYIKANEADFASLPKY